MSKHDKGPWEYVEGAIVGPKLDDQETWLRPVVARFSTGVSFANLNLMLAAPELLEAMEQMVSVFLDTEGSHGDAENDAMDAARAAIAKATGSEA